MKGILGRKVEMTQIFAENGNLIPVTVIEVLPNTVLQVRTPEKDGYQAIQLGVQDKRENLVNKAETGHFKSANSNPKRFVKEIRNMSGFEKGATITASQIFTAGEIVDVTGISKGKGFAGSVKRHHNHIGPKSHGSGYHRGVGSMGAIINRVFAGRKMPGHMGHSKVTVQNLLIVKIDENQNLIFVKGSIPGPKNSFLQIKENAKGKASIAEINLLTRKQVEEVIAPIEENVVVEPVQVVEQPVVETIESVEPVQETEPTAENEVAVEPTTEKDKEEN